MIPATGDLTGWFFFASGLVMIGAIAVATWRVFRGPSLPDRVIAIDMVGVFAVGMLVLVSIGIDRDGLLSVAMVAALILFLGTSAFAIYLERRGPEQPEQEQTP